MERKTKFRGVSTTTKNWVFGKLMYKYEDLEGFYVIGENIEEYHRVEPKTIGEFTGCKGGKDFHPDLVDVYENDQVNGTIEIGIRGESEDAQICGYVEFNDGCFHIDGTPLCAFNELYITGIKQS